MGALINIERIDFDKPISIYPSYVRNQINTPIAKSLTILPNPNHIDIVNYPVLKDAASRTVCRPVFFDTSSVVRARGFPLTRLTLPPCPVLDK